MKKLSTVRGSGSKIFKEHKLTIGLDLGDRSSYYCVLETQIEFTGRKRRRKTDFTLTGLLMEVADYPAISGERQSILELPTKGLVGPSRHPLRLQGSL